MRILSIGVSSYNFNFDNLDDAVGDAKSIISAFATIISDPTMIQSKLLKNPKKENVINGLEWLSEKNNEFNVLYFSGHAYRHDYNDSVALVCADSNSNNTFSFINGQDIGNILCKSLYSTILVILDCCFAEDIAKDISSRIGHNVEGIVILASSRKGMLSYKPINMHTHSNGYSEKNSFFTRNLIIGLLGISKITSLSELDINNLAELARFEALRLNGEEPTIIQQGIVRNIKLITLSKIYIPNLSVVKNVELTKNLPRKIGVHGSRGENAYCMINSIISDYVSLCGIGEASYNLSKKISGESEKPVILESVYDKRIIEQKNNRIVIGLLGRNPSKIINTYFQEIIKLPQIDMISLLNLNDNLIKNLYFEDYHNIINQYSFDSVELAKLAITSINLNKDKNITLNDLDNIVSSFLKIIFSSEVNMIICGILSVTPSYMMSINLLTNYLEKCLIIKKGKSRKIIQNLRNHGIITINNGRIGITDEIREKVFNNVYEIGMQHYVQLISKTLDQEKAHFRRLEAMVCMCASIEDALCKKRVPNYDLINILSKTGSELYYYLDIETSCNLLNNLISFSAYKEMSKLWIQLGNTYRLKDSYIEAQTAFLSARKKAKTEEEYLEAKIGLVSVNKNLNNGLRSINNTFFEMKKRKNFEGDFPIYEAKALFQQGNIAFAASKWMEALEIYQKAESLLDINLRSHTSLLIDVWKGLGDVILHMGIEYEIANNLCTMMIDLAAKNVIPYMDNRAHAKICQYTGDVLRYQSCINYKTKNELLKVSNWWYNKASEIYRNNNLQLGILLSEFRKVQNQFISNKISDLPDKIIALKNSFHLLSNNNWENKCNILLIAFDYCGYKIPPKYKKDAITSLLENAKEKDLSPYHHAWVNLLIENKKDDAITDFLKIGAQHLSNGLKTQKIDLWIGNEL